MTPFQVQLDRVRRRLWLVLSVAGLALLAALAGTAGKGTTFTAHTQLIVGVGADQVTVEQKAFLTQAYIKTLNDPARIQTLRETAKLSSEVAFEAKQIAAAPYIDVQATASTRAEATRAALAFSQAFEDDVAKSVARVEADQAKKRRADLKELASTAANLRRQVEALPASSATRAELQAQLESTLSQQDAIASKGADVSSDAARAVQIVADNAGVEEKGPGKLRKVILALIGGLILGTALALVLGTLDPRLATPADVRDRLGLESLAVVRAGSAATARRQREQDLKALANVVALTELEHPATIAVTGVGTSPEGIDAVATGLAQFRAAQGQRTVLMNADLHRRDGAEGRPSGDRSVADYLATGDLPPAAAAAPSDASALVVPAGRAPRDPYALFAPARFRALVAAFAANADLIVIAAPPVDDAAEAQVICSVATRTIVVVESGLSRADVVADACQLIDQVGGNVLGVVLYGGERREPVRPGRAGLRPGRRPVSAPSQREDLAPGDE